MLSPSHVNPENQCTKQYMDHMIGTNSHWHPRGVKQIYMNLQKHEAHGVVGVPTLGTPAPHLTIIDAAIILSPRQAHIGSLDPPNSFCNIAKCPS
jgi:hypothetical protein